MSVYEFLMVYFATVPVVCWACGSTSIGNDGERWWCNDCGTGGPLSK